MTGNIVMALAIIVVLVPLALLGVLGLAGVVLVHELAEVLVILNGVRASRVRRDPDEASSDLRRSARPTPAPGGERGATTSVRAGAN
ncbi:MULTISPECIES: hypothetical protein [unclassified Nocardioides]|uniref:hypothetical protein n=1 Tax=unclassified Nocardioides TaxID=2615069 RepID=UPI002404C9E8|nr:MULTISPECIES: hypothetical protein [unclassified Nocardioides]